MHRGGTPVQMGSFFKKEPPFATERKDTLTLVALKSLCGGELRMNDAPQEIDRYLRLARDPGC